MKKFALLALTAIMAIPVFGATEQLPPREQTLKTLIKVNDHYMRKHPDPYQGIPYYSRKKVYEHILRRAYGTPLYLSRQPLLRLCNRMG